MGEAPKTLTLVYLDRLDLKLDQVIEVQRDHGRRLTSLEMAIANLAASEANHYASLALRADRTDDRLDRIEKRLELRDDRLIVD